MPAQQQRKGGEQSQGRAGAGISGGKVCPPVGSVTRAIDQTPALAAGEAGLAIRQVQSGARAAALAPGAAEPKAAARPGRVGDEIGSKRNALGGQDAQRTGADDLLRKAKADRHTVRCNPDGESNGAGLPTGETRAVRERGQAETARGENDGDGFNEGASHL